MHFVEALSVFFLAEGMGSKASWTFFVYGLETAPCKTMYRCKPKYVNALETGVNWYMVNANNIANIEKASVLRPCHLLPAGAWALSGTM